MSLENTGALLRPAVAERCRVMIVDDDPLVRERMLLLLESSGYEAHAAETGEDALALARTKCFQIVITDWEMPGISGPDLCRELRREHAGRYTYVMIFTVRTSSDNVLDGLEAGADDYLTKSECDQVMLARVDVGRRTTGIMEALRLAAEENRRLSVTDVLTGAYNRRFLMKNLPREVGRARRYRRAVAVLSCDIDRFKHINDRFGHEIGDEVLKAFFNRAAGCLRPGIDWIARAGGEEFVIVLPETAINDAVRVGEKIRQAVKGQAIMTWSGPVNATVSIGAAAVATSRELGAATSTELLRLCDEAMHASKSSGRDRTSAAPPDTARTEHFSDFKGGLHDIFRPRSPLAPMSPEIDDRFEQLRETFHERLNDDRSELSGLHEELAKGANCASPLLGRLQGLAHRVAGAAALFGETAVMRAAVALEQASIDSQLPTPLCGPDTLRAAIDSLLDILPQPLIEAPSKAVGH